MKVFEKIAFSLVTLFGFTCFAVVVYGNSPDTREAVHDFIKAGSALQTDCSISATNQCSMYWLN